ncbi:MAG: ATP synthase F1 subunit delta [Flavobacteriales bacterium]
MINSKASKRYARSLIELAKEKNNLDKVFEDMSSVRKTCEEIKELTLLLKNPIVKKDIKQTVFKRVFKESLNDLSYSFIQLVIRKQREPILLNIIESFQEQYKEYNHIVTAEVTTAVALDKDLRNKIKELVKGDDEKTTVELNEKVEKNIIGGLILRVGEKQVDSSIKTQLNRFKRTLTNGHF